MNKLILFLLVVCLVSVHAFVKRDAPAAPNNGFDEAFKKLQDVASKVGNDLKEAFSQDNIKKQWDSASEQANKFFDRLKPTQEPPKA